MSSRVALVRTDVSEELSASIIRVTRICKLGKMLAVSSNRHTQLTVKCDFHLKKSCTNSNNVKKCRNYMVYTLEIHDITYIHICILSNRHVVWVRLLAALFVNLVVFHSGTASEPLASCKKQYNYTQHWHCNQVHNSHSDFWYLCIPHFKTISLLWSDVSTFDLVTPVTNSET
jgi:hypothetical protein